MRVFKRYKSFAGSRSLHPRVCKLALSQDKQLFLDDDQHMHWASK